MTELVQIKNVNTVHNQVVCDNGIARELYDHFSFLVPGHRYQPKFKARLWDGRIRLFSLRNNTIYAGLNHKVAQFCEMRNYELEYLDNYATTEFSVKEAKAFVRELNTPLDVRDYQLKTFIQCVRANRA